jgi:hypothetical protein
MEKKIANKLNFVTVTVVYKNGEILSDHARDFLFHALENEFVVDWVEGKATHFTIDEVESFMITR